ncbi:MAG: hypothetical protein U0795_10635 [Pirellulales bacterium]
MIAPIEYEYEYRDAEYEYEEFNRRTYIVPFSLPFADTSAGQIRGYLLVGKLYFAGSQRYPTLIGDAEMLVSELNDNHHIADRTVVGLKSGRQRHPLHLFGHDALQVHLRLVLWPLGCLHHN